jgi:hypothetical protein
MKKLLLMAAVASIAVACNNEASMTETSDSVAITPVDTLPVTETFTDYKEGDVIKKDGQLVVYTNGTWVPVEKDLVLDNGVTVKKSGEIVDKNGRTIVLEDGERVSKTGLFFNRAGAAVEDAWDATKRGVTNAAEATGNAVEKGYDATKKGVEKAADATKETAEDVGQAIKKGANKVGDKAKELKEDLKK